MKLAKAPIEIRPGRLTPLMLSIAGVVLLFAIDLVFAARTPVHLTLVSSGTTATLTVDGANHAFNWPSPPTRLTILPNDPIVHEWGVDGSETLTLNNLDPAYLRAQQTNPYVSFQQWMRGEDGFNQWHNVLLTDTSTGWVSTADTSQALAAGTSLPAAFSLDGDLYRIEKPVTIQFTVVSGTYQLHLDRTGRAVSVTNNPISGTATTVGQWFYPYQAGPFLAINVATLTNSVAWGLLLLAATVLLGWALPVGWLRRLQGLRRRAGPAAQELPWLILLGSFGLTLYISQRLYGGHPHIFDSQAYFFQGKLLASGRTSLPPPSPSPALFPNVFVGLVNGHWTVQYAPGTALSIVPGMLVGLPWLVQPLYAVGTLALVGLIGRRLYGPYVGTLAMLLGALSPLYSFLTGTYLSHTPTAFFATLCYYLLLRSDWGRRPWLTFAAGASAGMAILCREVTGSLVVLPLGVALALYVWRRGQARRPIPFGLWIGGIAVFIALYGVYNWTITGSPFTLPRNILNPIDRYGFGSSGYGWFDGGIHTFAAGLVNLDQLLTGLALDLYGWPYYITFAVPLLPFVVGRAQRWDFLNLAIALCLILGLVPVFYHGIIYGPRYTYEAVPALLLLTARGIQVLSQAAGTVLEQLRRTSFSGVIAAHALLGAFILCNVLYYMPRQMQLYRNFSAMGWLPDLDMTAIYNAPAHSIVATSDDWIYKNVMASLNDPNALANPTTTDDNVWVEASTPGCYARLLATYPHRRLLIMTVTNGTNVSYSQWTGTASTTAPCP